MGTGKSFEITNNVNYLTINQSSTTYYLNVYYTSLTSVTIINNSGYDFLICSLGSTSLNNIYLKQNSKNVLKPELRTNSLSSNTISVSTMSSTYAVNLSREFFDIQLT